MKYPLVTVLMPVYNGEKFLREAIDSILNQTFKDFEFLVIDDGSNDKSQNIVKSYSDSRIRLVVNNKNRGVIFSLNEGLKLARGKYVARMDADDISLPERLKKQVSFIEKHPEVGVCGTWTVIFSGIGSWQKLTLRFPTSSAMIKSALLFENVIQHPSVMVRAEVFRKRHIAYPTEYPHVEDYALWLQLSKFTNFAIIGEVLVHYRLHSDQIGRRHSHIQKTVVAKIHRQELKNLGISPTRLNMILHERISSGRFECTLDFVENVEKWLMRLKAINDDCEVYDKRAFAKILGRRWFTVCLGCAELGPVVWDKFWHSPLGRYAQVKTAPRLSFWALGKLSLFFRPLIHWLIKSRVGKGFRLILKMT